MIILRISFNPVLILLITIAINAVCNHCLVAREQNVDDKNPFQIDLNTPSTILNGKLINVPGAIAEGLDKIHVDIQSLDIENQYTRSYKIKPDSTFEITLDYCMPFQQFVLEIGDYHHRITVHDSVEALFDFKTAEQTGYFDITFSGKTAEWSRYLDNLDKSLRTHQIKQSFDVYEMVDSISFHRELAEWKTLRANFIKKYLEKHPPSAEISQWILTTEKAKYLAYFPEYYRRTEKTISDELFREIKEFSTTLSFLNYDTNNLLSHLSNYMRELWAPDMSDFSVEQFIDKILTTDSLANNEIEQLKLTKLQYLQYHSDESLQSDTVFVAELTSNMNMLNERYGDLLDAQVRLWMKANKRTRQYFILDSFPGEIGEMLLAKSGPRKDQVSVEDFDRIYREISAYINAPTISYFVDSYVNKVMRMATLDTNKKVEKLPDAYANLDDLFTKVEFDSYATLYHNDTLSGNEVFDLLIKQHEGQLMLIDFWATWCAPCFEDFAKAKLIKEQIDRSQLLFIYFCGDSDQEQWIKRIREKRVEGLHILLTDKQHQDLSERFQLNGYPSYLFIDQFGKVEFNARNLLDNPSETIDRIQDMLNGS
ncbi:hypothetical protein H8S90_10250 [Olivibacter sp. SDN3]|uniref:thioredoxin-like domain-containing protein n=1 Tax=Olivibacter sp. SDN3 TaxID=2764720 RepID=UPI00165196FA|nr:thioredoxin-like domain-containing protein [Olivibacter sp. SDN3]QNL51919.1 hypothetical protein H8S90_10250 [Olivibacter sp. SDN3]